MLLYLLQIKFCVFCWQVYVCVLRVSQSNYNGKKWKLELDIDIETETETETKSESES